ncbi:MAG: Sua5/YciO/YrdC/YwlC family protein [Candidatus Endonucleobacter bathymodioli]|uniref:Threonylcarbamoyl-AMP synthase n=1 Tax=Candidatus Endonucleibacter bathymodioli TaxID=539814 RepID=A0AA90SRV9_9GAMM|nr:Sua5/YciO/YrdC/YwlC family protein [Candidatus Endonucleobacter bathymodioli]
MILDLDQLRIAADVVTQGGVIAYPTEAVWGLGCLPWNRDAVYRILDIKLRPVEKGLVVVGFSEEQFQPILDPLKPGDRKKMTDTWPGPYTWIIPDPNSWAPLWVRGMNDSLAVRVSDHPVVRYLCGAIGAPLISTSANGSGEPPLLDQQSVEQQYTGVVDFIVSGEVGVGIGPTQIRDLITCRVIRAG